MVGTALTTKLLQLGHEVTMGAREAGSAKAVAWASSAGSGAAEGSFADAIEPDSGFPPRLSVCNGDSLGEQIQREFSDARVVKTLNTVNCDVMVDPGLVPGVHNVYVCGDDDVAKALVVDMLRSFGWSADAVVDLGDITAARGMEMYLIFWITLMRRLGTAHFNLAVHREG